MNLGLEFTSVPYATGYSRAAEEMSTAHLINVMRKHDLIRDVTKAFSEKVIIELRDWKTWEWCDSRTKFKLLEIDGIVRCVGPMG